MLNRKKQRIAAIVPVRKGSKRLLQKNLLPLAGKPLFLYSIEAAVNSKYVTETILSSEVDEVFQIAASYQVTQIKRPHELADDHIKNNQVLKHVVDVLTNQDKKPDILILLQPTSPLRNQIHLDECLEKFLGCDAKSAISVCQVEDHPAHALFIDRDYVRPFGKQSDLDKRISELPTAYKPNGAIYIVKTDIFLENLAFYHEPCMPYIMSQLESIDIDDAKAFYAAEDHLLRSLHEG